MLIPDSSGRAAKLNTFFRDVISGKRILKSPNEAKLFLEAVCSQQPATVCVERIVPSPNGLEAVRSSVRADLSPGFIQSSTLKLFQYLSDPGIKLIADGQLLQDLIVAIVDPPTVWSVLVNQFLASKLPEECIQPFAWLVLEVISLPSELDLDFSGEVRAVVEDNALIRSSLTEIRELGYMIKHVLELKSSASASSQASALDAGGGRHDNDFANFRKIQLYPTTDEFLSKATPFYRTLSEVFSVDEENRTNVHIDNQFRLLREDMLEELRTDLQNIIEKKKGSCKAMTLRNFELVRINHGDSNRSRPCNLQLECYQGLEAIQRLPEDARETFLKDQRSYLRHDSFGVLLEGKTIIGFAFLVRDEKLLSQTPSVIGLRFTDSLTLGRALAAMKTAQEVQFTFVDTPVFAYEPVLQGLQDIHHLPLEEHIMQPTDADTTFLPHPVIRKLTSAIEARKDDAGSATMPDDPKLRLDKSQVDSFVNAMTSPVTLIQGPPGTGKSFIGAKIVSALALKANMRVLVISYTNHALDQFLADLAKGGIPWDSMVRLGSKCTYETAPILLSRQPSSVRLSNETWRMVNRLKGTAQELGHKLHEAFREYENFSLTWPVLAEFLEFDDDGARFIDAFPEPYADSGWKQAGRNGKQVSPATVFQQWRQGKGPGSFLSHIPDTSRAVWQMPVATRHDMIRQWTEAMIRERVETIKGLVENLDSIDKRLQTTFSGGKASTLQAKSVIGCTTTAAASHSELIRRAHPDVVLVEEAGEILESHVLTALPSSVKQLILIGDHKQLRPKVNNYNLTVEKGEGYDLNRSMFERMILQGAPHTTLMTQHRMDPAISCFVRELTYPNLVDGARTQDRPQIRGLRDRVIFLNHLKQEETEHALADRGDSGAKTSKTNRFEAQLVLSCVKYLVQQGYKSDQIAILTPYLGQLKLLQDQLKARAGVDPLLNDMDSYELIRAGLTTKAAASTNQKSLRISTIDNYQGEESDIVVASLTRSNESGDIGFMAAPERLNVLLSRARNGLILVGNMQTFVRSKKGKATWDPFFNILQMRGHLYDGLPVRCEQHPDTTALLKEPKEFDTLCPDGGCPQVCGVILNCQVHNCRRPCHYLSDHTKVECTAKVKLTCSRNHTCQVKCAKQKDPCPKCVEEDIETERRIKRNLKMEQERLAREEAYKKELQQIQDELDEHRRRMKYDVENTEQEKTLQQERAALEAVKATAGRVKEQKSRQKQVDDAASILKKTQPTQPAQSSPPGTAKHEWDLLKQLEGAKCEPLDKLMDMIGLEDVKRQFLSIKSKTDALVRQNATLTDERFSISLLGNPGTGKTTVARLYAKFLNHVGVIPGSCFEETTGSRLANDGVAGCKKLLEKVLEDGGGVVFIDEAYQLSNGNSTTGKAVMDFLLAEVENLVGQVVFVLAGYNKLMEDFFAHNPGLPSRFPREMKFADYTDDELLLIFKFKIRDKYHGKMQCEDGMDGLYTWIVARRVGYARGSEGFGNARAVENALARVSDRQADRLRKERTAGKKTGDFLFTKEDLIGPEPTNALAGCAAWTQLQQLIGLGTVKTAVQCFVDTITENYRRELAREPPVQYSLNRVFLGSPGTGKTTIAKLFGQILAHLGLLSKGEVIVKNPSDFVGGYIGHSEMQTKGILASCVGKVLVIDEAYALYHTNGGNNGEGGQDSFKAAVIDTIVAEVQSVPGEDRCVLLLGYKDQMETMFQHVNPGLSRRFPMSSAFVFEDFTDDDLQQILTLKLKQQGFDITGQARTVAKEMLNRARNRPNFGNGGEIDIILGDAKARHQKRISNGETKAWKTLEALDFDENFDRADRNDTDIKQLFDGTIGCDEIVKLLEGYQETVRTMRSLDMDVKQNIPFNFLFRGPPGTGKTSTARRMGKVFYDMGFLATAEVIEVSASDLIGRYLGHTGPKVRGLLDKSFGKILFIDEAYRLGTNDQFAKEAIDELVDGTTKERYHKKMIIILAGYDNDINHLMTANAGITSRFPEVIDFRALTPLECLQLLVKLLAEKRDSLAAKQHKFDISILKTPTDIFRDDMVGHFGKLSQQDNWASARDVQTIAKNIFNLTIRSPQPDKSFLLKESVVWSQMLAMHDEREARSKGAKAHVLPFRHRRQQLQSEPPMQAGGPPPSAPPPPQASSSNQAPAAQSSSTTPATTAAPTPLTPPTPSEVSSDEEHDSRASTPTPITNNNGGSSLRDAGVTDAVWEQLQRDKAAEEVRELLYQNMLQARDQAASDEARDKIVRRLLEEEKKREEEERRKKALELSGRCVAGFAWVRQEGGYRCAGGAHFVGDEELGNV